MLVWTQKHTQFPGPGRTNDNVVGYPLMPIYMAKAGGFFFLVFGIITIIAGLVQINPIWLFGPYTPDQVVGRHPARLVHRLARRRAARHAQLGDPAIFGLHASAWNILIPADDHPGHRVHRRWRSTRSSRRWATGDKREHHLLDRPRNAPDAHRRSASWRSRSTRLLWIGGGNDIIAVGFDLSINAITWFLRIAIIVLPPIVFVDHQADLPGLCSAGIARSCCTAARPAASCACRTVSSSRCTSPCPPKDLAVITSKTDRAAAAGARAGRRRRRAQPALPLAGAAPQAQQLLLRRQRGAPVRRGDRGRPAPCGPRRRDRGAPARVRGRRPDPQRPRWRPAPPRHGRDQHRAGRRMRAKH